jgi:hypothetical protein
MRGFAKGVNLGGWLSQYQNYDHDHFRTFITEQDIALIASWGMDHVRLPVDYPVIEDDAAPGVPLESGYAYIDDCLAWCAQHGLCVVLDLHEAPGFTFTNDLEAESQGKNTLFEDEATQDRFVALWEHIVRRYQDSPVPLIFELLNEVTTPTNAPWNALAARTVAAIRRVSSDCVIMIGGTHNNAVSAMADLIVFDDPNVVYTFHFYDPLPFTHQNAPWVPAMRTWGGQPSYPGRLDGLDNFLASSPQFAPEHLPWVDVEMNRDLLSSLLAPAIAFAAAGRQEYCGGFGVADWVDPASRRAWMSDILSLLREQGIGTAVWSYKNMDFGLVDTDRQVVDSEYLSIISGR